MIDLYKIEEVNDNRFYQVPKELFQNPCYRFNTSSKNSPASIGGEMNCVPTIDNI
jgi:hypothetical protein